MRARSRWVLFGVLALGVSAALPAAAQEPDDVPRMVLDRNEVAVGETVLATMTGLEGESVTLTVCGNLARRGSQDCANSSGVGDEIVQGGPSYTQITVQPPPAPCPCVVRAVANGTRDAAVAPLTILGHPVGPVVTPPSAELVELAVAPRRADAGLLGTLRAALGGRTRYEVVVTVRNLTTERLDHVVVRASAIHLVNDDVADVPTIEPGPIEPGEVVTTTEVVDVAAPAFGAYRWTAVASGAGPDVEAAEELRVTPWLLYALLPVLVLDAGVMLWRLVARRTRRRHEIDEELHGADPAVGPMPA